MAARISKSLDTLRAQVNALAPKRSKASDGWLGDAKHSMRKSDHNPEPDGTVDAFDLTHDPKNGVDIQKICDAIVASRDRRVSYLICNGKIISGAGGPKPWVKRTYSGPNKHTKHLHVSVLDAHQDDMAPWKIDAAFGIDAAPAAGRKKPVAKAPVPRPRPAPKPAAENGDPVVRAVQEALLAKGFTEVGSPDGLFGTFTETAIMAWEKYNSLPPAGRLSAGLHDRIVASPDRVLSAARTEATPAEVRAQVPEVKSSFFAKVSGIVVTAAGLAVTAIGGIVENFKGAFELVKPVLETFSDVPWYVFALAVAGAGLWLWWQSRKGEVNGIAAFKAGERR